MKWRQKAAVHNMFNAFTAQQLRNANTDDLVTGNYCECSEDGVSSSPTSAPCCAFGVATSLRPRKGSSCMVALEEGDFVETLRVRLPGVEATTWYNAWTRRKSGRFDVKKTVKIVTTMNGSPAWKSTLK